ncbi:MAG: SDR family NAD(P)-dependent oxidoreductase, partial [Planctomycetota bacterium]
MDLGLEESTVLITGASGGIGRALARVFAEEGANLVLTGNSRFDELEDWARTSFGDRAVCASVDVRDPAACERAVDLGRERFGRVDHAVANAGVWPKPDRPLHELEPDRFADTVAVNLLGAAYTARAWMGGLAKEACSEVSEDGRACVLIGSTAGHFGERFHSDYAAAKAGLVGLMHSLKNELPLLHPGGRVNLIEPGWTVTEMAREALEDDAAVQRALETMALRRLGRAEDVARAAAFLCSPLAAAHLTGQMLTMAGGMEGRRL